MSQDGHRQGRLARLALKVCTVAGAVAALLGENVVGTQASEGPPKPADRGDMPPGVAIMAERPAPGSPPPLVLQPSRLGARLILAGHRSHSSHQSHSSHTSGASYRGHSSHTSHTSGSNYRSHSSHFSSSIGSRSSGAASGSSSSTATSPRPSVPTYSNDNPADSATDSSLLPPVPARVAPAPVPAPKPAVDYRNPLLRYQLITVGTYGTIQKAFIKDLLIGQPKLIKVGETIGDSTLMLIAPDKKSVRLKPSTGVEFTVYAAPAAR